jgi:hypothetical protein
MDISRESGRLLSLDAFNSLHFRFAVLTQVKIRWVLTSYRGPFAWVRGRLVRTETEKLFEKQNREITR